MRGRPAGRRAHRNAVPRGNRINGQSRRPCLVTRSGRPFLASCFRRCKPMWRSAAVSRLRPRGAGEALHSTQPPNSLQHASAKLQYFRLHRWLLRFGK